MDFREGFRLLNCDWVYNGDVCMTGYDWECVLGVGGYSNRMLSTEKVRRNFILLKEKLVGEKV